MSFSGGYGAENCLAICRSKMEVHLSGRKATLEHPQIIANSQIKFPVNECELWSMYLESKFWNQNFLKLFRDICSWQPHSYTRPSTVRQ